VYVDDVRACPPRCVPSKARPLADIAEPYDCTVDGDDMALLIGDWLLADSNTNPLLVWYKFDGDPCDSSIYGNDGNAVGDPNYTAGQIGQAIVLIGDANHGEYVIAGDVGIGGAEPRTIAGWAKADSTTMAAWTNVFGFTNSLTANQGGRSFDIEIVGDTTSPGYTTAGYFGIHVYQWEYNIMANDMDWHHFAATYDGTTIAWYGDGMLIGSEDWVLDTVDNVQIGKRADNNNYFAGLVDDVRVYDKALTQSEIQSIMDGSVGTVTDHHPIVSPANLYNAELPGEQWINFKDYSVIAGSWLDKVLWP
jgi:hypothetical protein